MYEHFNKNNIFYWNTHNSICIINCGNLTSKYEYTIITFWPVTRDNIYISMYYIPADYARCVFWLPYVLWCINHLGPFLMENQLGASLFLSHWHFLLQIATIYNYSTYFHALTQHLRCSLFSCGWYIFIWFCDNH